MSHSPRTLTYRRPIMSGDDVLEVQRRLAAHGFGTTTDADGRYGPATQGRVRAFQVARGLAIDGIVGPNTRRALRAPAGHAGQDHGRPRARAP